MYNTCKGNRLKFYVFLRLFFAGGHIGPHLVMLSEVEASVLELPPQRCCSSLFTKRDSLFHAREGMRNNCPSLGRGTSAAEGVRDYPPRFTGRTHRSALHCSRFTYCPTVLGGRATELRRGCIVCSPLRLVLSFRAFCRGRPVCLPFIVRVLHIVPLS